MITFDQFAGMHMHFRFHTFDAFLDAVERAGLRKIEVWGGYPHLYLPYNGLKGAETLGKKARARGLSVVCYTPEQCLYPINIADANPEIRRSSVAYFRDAVDTAAALEAGQLLVSSGWGLAEDDLTDSYRHSKYSLGQLCEYAAGKGIVLLMETLQRKESNLVYNLDLLREYVAELDSPYFQVVIDTVSMAAAGDTLEGCFEAFGEKLRHIHFIDGTPSGHIVWGEGNLPLEEYLRTLDHYGYRGALSFELAGYELAPEDALLRCAEACRQALQNTKEEAKP